MHMLRVACLVSVTLVSGLGGGCTAPIDTERVAADFEPTLSRAAAHAGKAGGEAFAEQFADSISLHFESINADIGDIANSAVKGAQPSILDLGESLGTSFGSSVASELAREIPAVTDQVADDFADALDKRVEAVSEEVGRAADEKFTVWLQLYFEQLKEARADEQRSSQLARDEERSSVQHAELSSTLADIRARLLNVETGLKQQPDQFLTIIGAIIGAVAATGTVLALFSRRGSRSDSQAELHKALVDSQTELQKAVIEIKGLVSSQRDKVSDIENFVRGRAEYARTGSDR